MNERRAGYNIHHDMINLLRQSVCRRLAGYEDVNGEQLLSADPVKRTAAGKKKYAPSINTTGRLETEILIVQRKKNEKVRKCFRRDATFAKPEIKVTYCFQNCLRTA